MLFRRTDKYGYSRYYGNGGPALVIKIILSVVIAAAIILGGATLLLQRYMVYTENGGHLELPWKNKKPPVSDTDLLPVDQSAGDENDAADLSLPIVEDAAPDSSAEPETNDAPQLPAYSRNLQGGLLVQHVSIGDMTGGHASGTLSDTKANGIMLFMKESGGNLNYNSTLPLAQSMGVSAGADKGGKIVNALRAVQSGNYYSIAYLNGFDDKKLSKEDGLGLPKQDGGTWSDSDDVKWADPANEKCQQYLLDVTSDMAELGFDEVVLYCASYPYGKKADKVKTDADRQAVITAFYDKLAKLSREKDITISVVADPNAILGKDSLSGQTLENLKSLGGRVWVMSSETDNPDALSDALQTAGFQENALGLISNNLERESKYSWLNEN